MTHLSQSHLPEGTKKKNPQHLKMNGFLRGVSLTHQIELQPKIITIGSDVCLIKKLNNKALPHIVGPECSRSMQNPGLSLWASTMTAWGASGIRWRLMLHPKKKKKIPIWDNNICQGKRGIHRALADYADLTHQSGLWRRSNPTP